MVAHLAGTGFHSIADAHLLSLHCGFFFVFECKISFPRFQYFFVDSCSSGSCDFSIFIEKLNLGPSTLPSYQETLTFISDLSHSYLLSFFFVNVAKSLEILFFISRNLLFISSILLFFLLYLHSNLYHFLLSASFGFTLLFFPSFLMM